MAGKPKFVPDEFDVALADWLAGRMRTRHVSWVDLQTATGIPERTLYRLLEPKSVMTLRKLIAITAALGTNIKEATDQTEILIEERRREASSDN
jgi:hypothetical protein